VARQLADSIQNQLQQADARELRTVQALEKQRDDSRQIQLDARDCEMRQLQDIRDSEQRATDRELRLQKDSQDREQRAMELELERERRADARETRLFDQFRDYLDTTRSDLKDAALVREQKARLESQLQFTCCCCCCCCGKSKGAHDFTHPNIGTSIPQSGNVITALSDVLPVVSCMSEANVQENYFSDKNNFSCSVAASNAMSVQSENGDVEFVDPHHVTRVPFVENISEHIDNRGSHVHFGKISESQGQTQNVGKFSKNNSTSATLTHSQPSTGIVQSMHTASAITADTLPQPVHTACTTTVRHTDGSYLDSMSTTTVPSYFGQSTCATQPPHPSEISDVAIDMTRPRHSQHSHAADAMALPVHMNTQSATVHMATSTCTQPLNPSGLSTAGAPALNHVSAQPIRVPTTHDLVDLSQHPVYTTDGRVHSVYTPPQAPQSTTVNQPCATVPVPFVQTGQSVCTPVAHTQLMYTPVHNIDGHTPQALASSVIAQQSLVPVHSHAAHRVTGSDAQLSHVVSASTPLPLAHVAPPLAFADVPALSAATLTSQCTTTDTTAKQEDALGHCTVGNTVTPAITAVNQSSCQSSTVNQTSAINQSSNAVTPAGTALSANPNPTPAVVFKQLTQPRTYNGSSNWKDYKSHFERVCKVNSWNTPQDRAQNLTLALESPAADVLKDVDELAPNAYDQIWQQTGRRFGHTDAPRDAMRRFGNRRPMDNESL